MSIPPLIKKPTIVLDSLPEDAAELAALKEKLRDGAFLYIKGGTGGGSGNLSQLSVKTTVYDVPGIYSWTPSANLLFAIVKVQAGGGGGGGCEAYGTPGGGQAGGYCEKLFLGSDLSSSETITVGAGGSGGAAGAHAGESGASSSFGTRMTAFGGSGGNGAVYVTNPSSSGRDNPPSTTLPVGGDINLLGDYGRYGFYMHAQGKLGIWGGDGAVSPIGGNGANGWQETDNARYGGGGAGRGGASNRILPGFKGGDGVVVVQEYFLNLE